MYPKPGWLLALLLIIKAKSDVLFAEKDVDKNMTILSSGVRQMFLNNRSCRQVSII